MSRIAALTGATGFLGRHVAAALVAAGWDLRLLVRRDPRFALGPRPITLVPGSLADGDALDRLTDGADAVIHVAGAIRGRSRADFMAVNAQGSADLVAAWRRGSPEAPFVLVSSLAARAPGLSHYAASKALGEAALDQAGGATLILRPGAIYGAGDRETLGLFQAARRGVQPMLGGPDARVVLIDVRDVAAAVVAGAEGRLRGRYELSDARQAGYSWAEIAEAAAGATGARHRPVRVPPWLLQVAALCGDLACHLPLRAPMLTSAKLREIRHPDWGSDRAAQPPTEVWQPRIALAQGFADAVQAHRAAGWLAAP